ncbi:MAG: DUF1275 domain-containing protein [Alphaproteobacteria bacterium]|nr:DUF1275 domain-containing protein [Alphaproteobacteria bacterium]
MTKPTSAAHGPARRGGDLMEAARGLALAAMLAGLAGMVDAIGYLHLRGLFVSFMSGNSTQLAAALGQGDPAMAATIAELIALFVLGAAAGEVLAGCTGKWHMTGVLSVVALLLTIAALLATTPEPMVFAMGVLNSSMHRAGNIPVSLTFVTGVLVRFGQGLGNFLTRRATGWNWLAQAAPWVGMIIGATISAVAYVRIGDRAVWLPIALASVLVACSAAMRQPD